MTADRVLAVVGGAFGAAALVGYGRAFAGVSRARRAVRVPGRVVAVDTPPASGSDSARGIPVVIAFRDAAGGTELTLPTASRRNGRLTEAWVGRDVGVRHPPGRPQRFTVSGSVTAVTPSGLRGPTLLAVPACAALLLWLALHHGWGWAPLGGGAAFAALMGRVTVAASHERSRRAALLTGALTAPGRVVAVQEHTSTDDSGARTVTFVPVVAFTTSDGRVVTGQCRTGIRDVRRSLGSACQIHYAPSDPAVFTADPAAERLAGGCGLFLAGFLTVLGLAVTVVGLIALP
ncbi:DUF3592 domain-containing protein [Actinacidiphila acidipaludis]|uniref:DUF3592 domain-containing protein n=1 Tax=Actinacidiphila acidipaludis TaxID=2873382 RepID=A0ABS7QCK1_9ACTN|nr:DUF3592 domain-containing protein [Streptomyces acidipaludis]MBY8880881.1 DUF3592 domain-containing protein [Streptomyces acidipaludis]